MRDAAAVPDHKQTLVAGLEILVDVDGHVVELDLDAIKQGVITCGTRCNFVEGIDHLDDVVKDALRDNQGQVPGDRFQCRVREGFGDTLRRTPLAADQIAESLQHDTAAQHVRQARDALAVPVAVGEGLGEVLRDQQREVCVFCLAGRILIAVSIDRDDAVGVLRNNSALGVHAEGTHQILVLFRLVDDLALVQLICDVLENRSRKLDTDSDIDTVRFGWNIQVRADRFHPFGAGSPDRDDAVVRGECTLLRLDGKSWLICPDAADRRVEIEVHFILQPVVNVAQHLVVDVRSEMADGSGEQMHVVLQAARAELRVARRVELRLSAAVLHIDLIDILHQVNGFFTSDVLVERAAELICNVVLSVGKCACAAEPAHDGAGLAVDAVFNSVSVNRASALRERPAVLKHGNFYIRTQTDQLVGRKNAAGACADDNGIVMIHIDPLFIL